MPELPEVEVVRQQLEKKIVNKTIEDIDVRDWKSVKNDRYFITALTGSKFKGIDRKGKYLFFRLTQEEDNQELFIICHLKMTGRLIFQTPAGRREYGGGHALNRPTPDQPHKHTRVIFTFKDGSHLYFNDMRKFGYLKRSTVKEVKEQKEKLGREPIGENYDREWFADVFAGRQTSVKAVLLGQKDIAGLGNIYVDEALWRSSIRPDRTADSLSSKELDRLFVATREVLEDSLELGGTTFRDFADTGGEKGNFTDKLAVFGREGEKCEQCGASIKKIRCAGRGTHFCPDCQV